MTAHDGGGGAERDAQLWRAAGLLTIAFGIAGLLVYVYFALASHNLDPEVYGQLVVVDGGLRRRVIPAASRTHDLDPRAGRRGPGRARSRACRAPPAPGPS